VFPGQVTRKCALLNLSLLSVFLGTILITIHPHTLGFIGYSAGTYYFSDSIYQFVTEPEEGWVELPQKLSSGLQHFDAILVPEDFIDCNL